MFFSGWPNEERKRFHSHPRSSLATLGIFYTGNTVASGNIISQGIIYPRNILPGNIVPAGNIVPLELWTQWKFYPGNTVAAGNIIPQGTFYPGNIVPAENIVHFTLGTLWLSMAAWINIAPNLKQKNYTLYRFLF